MLNRFLLIFALLILTSCAGESTETCIPSNTTTTTATGVSQSSAEEIFNYLKDKKIVTTVIADIKAKVIGSSSGGGGAAENMFTAFTSSPSFNSALTAAFTLAVMFYGIGVATGIIQTQVGDALVRLAKIVVVAIVATNWTFFYNTVGVFFINATDELMYYMLQNFSDLYSQGPSTTPGGTAGIIGGIVGAVTGGSSGGASIQTLFSDIDIFFAQLFSIHSVAIVSALISLNGGNAGPYSNIYALFLIFSMFQITMGLLRVVAIYAFSLFARALLFALAPIFFTFILFTQTKTLFDAWLKLMITYTLQPVILSAFLGIFIGAFSSLFKEVYALRVCYIPDSSTTLGWHFVDANKKILPTGAGSEVAIHLESLLTLFFFAWMFTAYIKLAEGFTNAITQSQTGNLGDAIAIADLNKKK